MLPGGRWPAASPAPPACWRAAASTCRRGRGHALRFADGTSARVYRETVADGAAPADPCVLVVEFRLRAVRGRGHALFRRESLLNTPLFVGFPGFVSKLWLAHDEQGVYRGLYEWDGPAAPRPTPGPCGGCSRWSACRGSIHYVVLPGLRRDELLAGPDLRPADEAPVVAAGGGGMTGGGHPGRRRRSDRPGARPCRRTTTARGPGRRAAARGVPALAGADRAPPHAGGAAPARRDRRAAGRGDTAPRAPAPRRPRPGRLADSPARHRLPAPDASCADGRRDGAGPGARRPRGRGGTGHRAGRLDAGDRPAAARRCARRPGLETLPCRFVAGCDGADSTVRAPAGIGWRGGPTTPEVVLADLELDGDLAHGVAHVVAGRRGLLFVFALGEHATWRLLATRPRRRRRRAARPSRSAGPGRRAPAPARRRRARRPDPSLVVDAGAAAAPAGRPRSGGGGCSSPATPRTPTPRPPARA